VGERGLMDVSAVEQEVATGLPSSSAAHADAVRGLLADGRPSPADKARAVALFALRHERTGDGACKAATADLVSRLAECPGVPRPLAAAVGTMLRHAGAARRAGDLFSDASLGARLTAAARAATTSLRGVDNVYTQHSPALMRTLDAALRGRLKDADWPTAGAGGGGGGAPGAGGGGGGGAAAGDGAPAPSLLPRLVVAFIVGGTTYQEAAAVGALNAQLAASAAAATGTAGSPPPARVILGGTGVLNSAAFLDAWQAVGEAERAHV